MNNKNQLLRVLRKFPNFCQEVNLAYQWVELREELNWSLVKNTEVFHDPWFPVYWLSNLISKWVTAATAL